MAKRAIVNSRTIRGRSNSVGCSAYTELFFDPDLSDDFHYLLSVHAIAKPQSPYPCVDVNPNANVLQNDDGNGPNSRSPALPVTSARMQSARVPRSSTKDSRPVDDIGQGAAPGLEGRRCAGRMADRHQRRSRRGRDVCGA